jgi:hypothetical protein
MKFLPEEHETISALLIESGLPEEQFFFRKREATCILKLKTAKIPFVFIAKQNQTLTLI